jgi:very-short-patch-repair endonuclease
MSEVVPGWPVAFRGSLAVAAGLVTRDRLRGPAFRRLLPDIYVRAGGETDLLLRALAAYRLVEGRGVLAGYSAALLLGADCAPHRDVPAEVIVPGGGRRAHPGLLVRRDRIADGETWWVGDVRCTSPLRTAYDLGRRGPLVDRVVAVDRLANQHRFDPNLLINFAVHYRRGRGARVVHETLAHTSPYSGSPMETRLRLLIDAAGLPRPQVQWPVQDPASRTAVWIDLAWPDIHVGVEYEGEIHTGAESVRRDTRRFTALVDKGWRIYRYTKDDILHAPERIVAELTSAVEMNVTGVPGGANPRHVHLIR